MQTNELTRSRNGTYTYAFVDCPNDKWLWAIVTEHKDSQDYGFVVMAFADEYEPDPVTLGVILDGLESRHARL